MSLVPCKECGTEISSNATVCPRCGTPDPASYLKGTLVFYRVPKTAGVFATLRAYLDDQLVGEFSNGDKISIEIPAGIYRIRAEGRGKIQPTTLTVEGNKQYLIKLEATLTGAKIEIE